MFYSLKDEGVVQLAGEAAQPPEAHRAKDGDLLGGRRVRRPCEHQEAHVAHLESDQAQRGPRVPLGPADEGHRVQEKIKTWVHIIVSHLSLHYRRMSTQDSICRFHVHSISNIQLDIVTVDRNSAASLVFLQ